MLAARSLSDISLKTGSGRSCILEPQTSTDQGRPAGVFAHESFGHKSEADFMLGDETMKKEWQLGRRLGPDFLHISDYGALPGPAQISVISGSVFDTFDKIDAISDQVELLSFVGGGCGKMEQFPLPVGFGGPYVRVLEMAVL
jgi:predicted Zn-dependent protease